MTRTRILKLVFCVFFVPILNIASANDCSPWVAKAISIQGEVEHRTKIDQVTSQWIPIKRDDEFCAGATIRVKQNSRAALILKNDTILRLNQNTTITLSSLSPDQSHWINLEQGIAHFIARIKQTFKVITPFVNAAVEGTEFVVSVNTTQTEVTVFEGTVVTKNTLGEVKLTKGQTAIATENAAPALIIQVKPRDAVQWSLYYPVVINFDSSFYQDLSPTNKTMMDRSIAAARRGQFSTALEQVNLITGAELNSTLLIYRAALYLSVGQIDKAKQDIQQVTQSQPNNAEAISLQAIIAIVQNDKAKALSLAKQAATLTPDSASSALALSYVHQSLFDINSALEIIKIATTNNKDNALLWSRLSALYLMVGDLDEALKAAKRANTLNPNIARTHSALGFAYLSRIEVKKAEQAFKDAILKNDSDPLSRLGLGLAIIRQGDLERGRREIEFAATLDPNNALIRSYLGKAYYEEKRDELANTQFEMAKQLDPNDPTAYYYSAIMKQNKNNPVSALRDLEKSISLNNNRAIFRSQMFLDEDLASQGISQASIYNNLDFTQISQVNASNSLAIDPANHSAHYFISDSYSSKQRQEIARSSEFLQGQLFQPLTNVIIQPQSFVSNLSVYDKTSIENSTSNEFSSMFSQNRLRANLSVAAGNNQTKSSELIMSGLYNSISFSAGKFNYDTNGFREGSEINHNISNLFIQGQLSSKLDIQLEYRSRKTNQGDLRIEFDPSFEPTDRRKLNDDSTRLGFHYSPTKFSDFIATYTKDEREKDFIRTGSTVTIDNHRVDDTDDLQAQYIFKENKYNVILGIGKNEITGDSTTIIIAPFPTTPNITKPESELENAYLYTNITPSAKLAFTLGLSYDQVFSIAPDLEIDDINPKFGMNWLIQPKTQTRIRFAAYKNLKRFLLVDQTLEPTQIVGFNQFFNDPNGTKTKVYGIGIDSEVINKFYIGAELFERKLSIPNTNNNGDIVFEEQEQNNYTAYLKYIVNNNWILNAKYEHEFINTELGNISVLKTDSFPLTIQYHNISSGFFTRVSVIYVKQDIDYSSLPSYSEHPESFILTDLLLGYKLDKRMGEIKLEVDNIFGNDFLYQDNSFINADKFNSFFKYIPDKTIMLRFDVNF